MEKSINAVNVWRARPVFISSTFKDMQAERGYLQNHIFPRLEEKLRERRHQFEPIDLRMGVETADLGSVEARELLVLKVCLEEIKRSRPFLLVLLGDRYGWVPPPERMETATQEAGFKTEVRGKSVTALEIEFGVLLKEHSEQRRRSFFYFRDPLPYDKMTPATAALYTDEFAADPQVRAGHDKLKELKQQLRDHPELGSRVHTYHAEWDENTQRVAGLEAWGEMVFQHLWEELEEETRDFASRPPETWEQRERAALSEFAAQRSRDFTGRAELLSQLLEISRSPAAEGAVWGACVSGEPGSGKSAVLAELYQRLAADKSILILANAAGATPRGMELDAMLRRFVGELADSLQLINPLATDTKPDDVEIAFAALLVRAAKTRRVVVLLDALDQFDSSTRAQHFTWLRTKKWPANARIIATGIAGTVPVEALSQWVGIEELELPSLDAPDVTEIARRVWARYHRQVNPEVLRVLEEKKLPNGQPAAGNPLWLTLALEQINLLDADDFARADREFAGGPAERLRAMQVDTANRMPPDVTALYGWLLVQTEKTYGAPHARAFAVLIALGRFGWRETDLLVLVPRVARMLFPEQTVSDLDDLALASIRRGFRAHLARRGAAAQLDFFHAQMREAVQVRALSDGTLTQAIHRAIADHLETLPETDPLRESELMVHLIMGDDAERAARVYADVPWYSRGLTGATQALARYILICAGSQPNPHAAWVAALFLQPNLSGMKLSSLGNRFNFDLNDALANTDLPTRQVLLEAAQSALTRLAASDPANAAWQRDLSVSLNNLGDLAVAQGELAGALRRFTESMTIRERLAASDPANAEWQRDLSVSLNKLGDLAVAQGDLAGALRSFTESKTIRERLAASDPANAAWQRDLSVSLNKLGDLAVAQGDLAGALRSFTESKTIAERLAASDPANAEWQRDLSISLNKLGDLAVAQGDLAGALRSFTESKTIRERLAASDPANAEWQRDLSVSLNKLGNLAVAQGDLAGALRSFTESKTIRERLAASDPANAAWQRDLFVSQVKLGDLAVAQGDLAGALRCFTESKTIAERLAASDPANAAWQRDLIISFERLGDIAREQGDIAGSIAHFEKSRDGWAKLIQQDPANISLQRGITVPLNELGDLAVAQGDLAGALRCFTESKAIAERLAANDPANAAWQRDLSVSHFKFYQFAEKKGDSVLAGTELRACYNVLVSMKRRGLHLDPQMAQLYSQLADRFGGK